MFDAPLIVNLAPTGAVADHHKNPAVPVTAEAIAADVALASVRGASVAHLHVRGDLGAPSSDPRRFADLIGRIRSQAATRHLILCASTSGRHGQTREERAAVLGLPEQVRPDLASLTLGSVNFPGGASVNDPDTIRYLLDEMNRHQVKPELEIFDAGMIEFAKLLIGEGRIQPPYYFNVILGNVAGFAAEVGHLAFALANLPAAAIVSVGGIGRTQRRATALAVAAAHGVRIGLEDNLWSDWTTRTPATNSGLVDFVAGAALALRRRLATIAEARDALGLPVAL